MQRSDSQRQRSKEARHTMLEPTREMALKHTPHTLSPGARAVSARVN
ncbi:hypothetical protein PAMC26510_33805 [Caballeronia sordidicola]|uniref:Uncharacterized protein n=1 Tax=Caballeronia sordidicola TaxID=196367 RepID=A0A242M868_CABSO|nr:hypothetical protein PAMC26510_33805 [Caballeronia sordidicola]OTP79598.1 hypothetical protein PAMC26577_01625 [Caballeronia sordidicola]